MRAKPGRDMAELGLVALAALGWLKAELFFIDNINEFQCVALIAFPLFDEGLVVHVVKINEGNKTFSKGLNFGKGVIRFREMTISLKPTHPISQQKAYK